jgi:hypothetical protein
MYKYEDKMEFYLEKIDDQSLESLVSKFCEHLE